MSKEEIQSKIEEMVHRCLISTGDSPDYYPTSGLVRDLVDLIEKLLNDQRITNLKMSLETQTWLVEQIGPILEQADERRNHLKELIKMAESRAK